MGRTGFLQRQEITSRGPHCGGYRSGGGLPKGSICFVTTTLVSPDDYEAVMAGGDAKRQELAASLAWRS